MATLNELSASSDKIISVIGEKFITSLTGEKYGVELLGLSDKTISLTGEKNITTFNVTSDKSKELEALKYIADLEGLKYLSEALLGLLDKSKNLQADGAGVGWWYILVDTTLITADNTYVTVDRTPNIN